MRLLTAALAAIVVVATLAAPGHAQQRLKQRLEQRREASHKERPVALPAGGTIAGREATLRKRGDGHPASRFFRPRSRRGRRRDELGLAGVLPGHR